VFCARLLKEFADPSAATGRDGGIVSVKAEVSDGLRRRRQQDRRRRHLSPHHRTLAFAKDTSMLTRSLFTLIALVLFAVPAIAQDVPAKLAPPQERPLLGKYAAKGVQIYVCSVKGGANEWAFKAPEAELIDAQGRLFAKHYAGPSWEAADGSKIVGKVLANEPAPKAGAIPWLLLSTESSGSGELAGARFVQRVNTSGGVGPTGACPTVGTEQRVDYTADYIFYK
jgi:hypothetical protein